MSIPQTRLYQFQPFGVVGDLFDDTPRKMADGILASASAANNVIGRAFTYVNTTPATNQVMSVQAGGSGNTAPFAGILVNSKQYVLYGTAGNTLAPTLTLPNSSLGSFLQAGRIIVSLPVNSTDTSNNPLVGDQVIYNTTTGVLDSIKPGTSMPSGFASAHAAVSLLDPNIPTGYLPTQNSVLAAIDVNYNPYP